MKAPGTGSPRSYLVSGFENPVFWDTLRGASSPQLVIDAALILPISSHGFSSRNLGCMMES